VKILASLLSQIPPSTILRLAKLPVSPLPLKSQIQRILLLALVLPQLLWTGISESLVICVTSEGHLELEFGASKCCAASTQGPLSDSKVSVVRQSEALQDCDACSDFRISEELQAKQQSGTSGPDLGMPFLPFDRWLTALRFGSTEPLDMPVGRGLTDAMTLLGRCPILRC